MRTRKRWIALLAGTLALAPLSFAKASDDAKDERNRLHNADAVMHEILNVPDNIPQDLLNKARCVIVMPSVLKAAFIVGGSYGRAVQWSAARAMILPARGELRPCMRWKAAALAFKSAAKPRTLFSL